MRLDRLLGGVDVLETVGDAASVDILSVTHDSRTAAPGSLFCCVPGATADGHDYAPQAVAAGAAALLCERLLDVDAVQIRVPLVRPAMARAAATLFGNPSERMTVVGVTGTNGKTTVTHMLKSVLGAAGIPTEVMGTLSGARTTPEAPELQGRLAELAARGTGAVAMEVSSHALDQHRVDGVRFSAAVFTNLSHDHLDYHGSMERYFSAKAELFRAERTAQAVVNVSDPWGSRLADALAARGEPVLHRFSDEDASHECVTLTGVRFDWRQHTLRVPMGGRISVLNALAAATTASALGVEDDAIVAGLAATPPVPGRMEIVDAGQPFTVVVDYAHTPDGLERTLDAARRSGPGGRVAVVFGCGGRRDRAKRPLMGQVAGRLADLVVVTTDNPRDEDPSAIVADVIPGVPDGAHLVVEGDRRSAIGLALDWAEPGDVVVVAGKGHETGQDIGGRILPFDDRTVSRELLASGRWQRAGGGE